MTSACRGERGLNVKNIGGGGELLLPLPPLLPPPLLLQLLSTLATPSTTSWARVRGLGLGV